MEKCNNGIIKAQQKSEDKVHEFIANNRERAKARKAGKAGSLYLIRRRGERASNMCV
jgi:hypothetical protein